MKIFSAAQFREWDAATISNEPISSIDLMERAASQCCQWIIRKKFSPSSFRIFCGKGNNGGDGLALARLLHENDFNVEVYIVESGSEGTADYQINLQRLSGKDIPVTVISDADHLPAIEENSIAIDALFGTGLNKRPRGIFETVFHYLNTCRSSIISIDMPSGMYADESSIDNPVVHARYTLSFGANKLAFMMAENSPYFGEVEILNIGLDKSYYEKQKAGFELVDEDFIRKKFKPRNTYAHKGEFGHAMIAAGSYGKMGAAILAAKACLHSGSGLLTMHIPRCGYDIIQTSVPEAMAETDEGEKYLQSIPVITDKFNTAGIGPGIGTETSTVNFVSGFLKDFKKPVVIDADGLNCIALDPAILSSIPPFSILTPHPKEFDRLFGNHKNEFERIRKAIEISHTHNLIIVLKGHHTLIAGCGAAFFNSTGNAGMAKGGSGDVLTGLLTSFLAQGYFSLDASLVGCYIHGLAGDFAAAVLTQEYMTAMNIVENLPSAFRSLRGES